MSSNVTTRSRRRAKSCPLPQRPSTYGPLATIPDQGFLVNSDMLLRGFSKRKRNIGALLSDSSSDSLEGRNESQDDVTNTRTVSHYRFHDTTAAEAMVDTHHSHVLRDNASKIFPSANASLTGCPTHMQDPQSSNPDPVFHQDVPGQIRDIWPEFDPDLATTGFRPIHSNDPFAVAFNGIKQKLFSYLDNQLPNYFCTLLNVRIHGDIFIPSIIIATSNKRNFSHEFTLPDEVRIQNTVYVLAVAEYSNLKRRTPPSMPNVLFQESVKSGSSIGSSNGGGTVGIFMKKKGNKFICNTSASLESADSKCTPIKVSSEIYMSLEIPVSGTPSSSIDSKISSTTGSPETELIPNIPHSSSSSSFIDFSYSTNAIATDMFGILSAKSSEDDIDNSIVGITASHIFKDGDDSDAMVTQPDAYQYHELIKSLQEKERKIRERKRLAKTHDMRTRIDKELLDAKLFLAEIESHTDFEFGQLERREEAAVDYKGRRCVADWAVFKVNKRGPSPADWDYIGPEGGFLGTLEWDSCSEIGELAYDLYVRKNGAQSGMTFGLVAGCPAGVKMFDKPFDDALEEYVIVKEEKWEVCQFR